MNTRITTTMALLLSALVGCGGNGGGDSTPAADAGSTMDTGGGGGGGEEWEGDENDMEPVGGSFEGGEDPEMIGSCQIRRYMNSGTRGLCIDYDTGFNDGSAQSDCTERGGTWVDNRTCATGSIGACTVAPEGGLRTVERLFGTARCCSPTAADLEAHCTMAGGTYEAPPQPTNAGRCNVPRAEPGFDNTNSSTCTYYDRGYTVAQAQSACTERMGTFSAGSLCGSSTVGGCRLTAGTQVRTLWFYRRSRSGADVTAAQVEAWCEEQSGEFIARMM
jgi:hypothetical protein